ncbi:unnamed protein product, partial [Cladocopium goreaui]
MADEQKKCAAAGQRERCKIYEEATSGAKASKKDKEVKQAVAPNFQVPQTPLMRQVEGMIKAHHHSDAFLKETTDYVKRFTLHTE